METVKTLFDLYKLNLDQYTRHRTIEQLLPPTENSAQILSLDQQHDSLLQQLNDSQKQNRQLKFENEQLKSLVNTLTLSNQELKVQKCHF
jgi:regulator of replication initiation timing